jgi:hypothetical protein
MLQKQQGVKGDCIVDINICEYEIFESVVRKITPSYVSFKNGRKLTLNSLNSLNKLKQSLQEKSPIYVMIERVFGIIIDADFVKIDKNIINKLYRFDNPPNSIKDFLDFPKKELEFSIERKLLKKSLRKGLEPNEDDVSWRKYLHRTLTGKKLQLVRYRSVISRVKNINDDVVDFTNGKTCKIASKQRIGEEAQNELKEKLSIPGKVFIIVDELTNEITGVENEFPEVNVLATMEDYFPEDDLKMTVKDFVDRMKEADFYKEMVG